MSKQTPFIPFFILIVLTSCQKQRKENPETFSNSTFGVDTAICPTDSNELYFPVGVFRGNSSNAELDSFISSWYSKHLFTMREPIIYSDNIQTETYRFTWLRTFNNPISIRIEKHGYKYILIWKLCNGAGGYKPGRLTINKQKEIDQPAWEQFQANLRDCDFWNLETKDTNFGFDGSEWILEAKTPEKYHVVNRWTPPETSKFYQCCDFLIRLTDLKIKIEEKY